MIRLNQKSVVAICVALCTTACTPRPIEQRQPSVVGLPVSTPEAQGISSSELAKALQFARANNINIHSLAIVRNGVLVLDAYFHPYTSEMRHDVASVTKSITALLVGIASADGQLGGADQPLLQALPAGLARSGDARLAGIRLGHLVAMQSGFDCGFKRGEQELVGMIRSRDWLAYALNMPMIAEPGTRFGYCSPNFHLLSAAIATASKRSTLDVARARLFEPLGIHDVHWPADARGINHGWGDLQLHPRDMAKIGLLMLDSGQWQGRRIVPKAWIDSSLQTTSTVNENDSYGLGWWLSRRVPTLFEANGRGGQRISVIPAKRIVVVMTGGGFEPGRIGGFLLNAIRADSALPADAQGEAELAEALRAIAAPPPARALSRSETAAQVSGRVYALDSNPLGLRSFAIDFPEPAEAILRLELPSGEKLVQRLGLDGVYRLSPGQYESVSAGRAEWRPDGRFHIELNTLTRINRYLLDVEFRGDSIRVTAAEPTELGTVIIDGKANLDGSRND